MTSFELHPQLRKDCILLGQFPLSTLLLMNNASVPWFILVPRNAQSAVELTDLSFADQTQALQEINAVASLVKASPDVEKLNIAALGNIVPQLHIHVVGRSTTDYCWPKLVWVADPQPGYDAAGLQAWQAKLAVLADFSLAAAV